MATSKRTGPEQVADFMDRLDHPLKAEIGEVRRMILSVSGDITEHIKWNAPSFCVGGEDRITFNLQGKGFFRLIFHRGAKVKADKSDGPLFQDETGLLEWVDGDRAIVKLTDMDDVMAKRQKLAQVVSKWIEAAG